MTGDEIRTAFAPFLRLLRDGDFADPPDGWSAELIGAHVARNNDAFTHVAQAIAADEDARYDNEVAVDTAELRRLVTGWGGRAAVADEVEASADRLAKARDALDDDHASRVIPIRIHSDGELVHDGPGPVGEWIDGNATFHLRLHAEQLRALLVEA
jgi:hypothetical protein